MTDKTTPCVWSQDDAESDVWNTSCGKAFTLNDGTPKDNHIKYCFFCGKPCDEAPYEESNDD